MSKILFKSAFVVVTMTIISRVFGFVRDMLQAHFFGAGAMFDAFSVAFRIPNFMRRLFAEGSFSQAFVPVLSEYQKQKQREDIQRFINAMSGTLGLVLFGVTIVGVVGAPVLVKLFAPGFATDGERFHLAVTMLRVTFPYLFFISLTAFCGSILNTYSRFWVAALTPVLLNMSMIVAMIWFSPHFAKPIIALAWGVFVAGILQLLFQIPFLWRLQLMPRPHVNFRDEGVVRVLKLMVPALFGVSVGQINLLIDTLFASFLVVGSMSWLYYSDRLMEFPLGVFGTAFSTVILPHLSRHHATHSHHDFSHTLDWALRCVLLVGVPAGVILAVLSGPLLSTLFQHGKFDNHDVIMARKSVSMFAVGIAPFMLVKILASGFYAKQNIKLPVKIGIAAMISNMIFNVILIWPLKHAGIALATSLAAVLNASCLFYFLYRSQIYLPRAGWKLFFSRLLTANIFLGIGLWYFQGNLQDWLTQTTRWRCEHLFGLGILAIFMYFFLLWIMGLRRKDIMLH